MGKCITWNFVNHINSDGLNISGDFETKISCFDIKWRCTNAFLFSWICVWQKLRQKWQKTNRRLHKRIYTKKCARIIVKNCFKSSYSSKNSRNECDELISLKILNNCRSTRQHTSDLSSCPRRNAVWCVSNAKLMWKVMFLHAPSCLKA